MSSVRVYAPAGSLERIVSTSPDVNETAVLSSLTLSATSLPPCLAVTPLRSMPSVDFTVSAAPLSSAPFDAAFLLKGTSIALSSSSSFSTSTSLPFSSISKSIAVSVV